jgi:hypothetical protein
MFVMEKTKMKRTELTEAEVMELKRYKAYFPYRICFAALNLETGICEIFCRKTKRKMNELLKKGYLVWEAK